MLVEKVERTLRERRLIEPGTRGVVAVSGGSDSTALLDVLVALAPRWGLALHVAHFHHGLRGPDADADEAFVRALADERGLPCSVERASVEDLAAREGLNLEDAGRRARYAFLQRVRRAAGADWVATGHTLDDQAETVLLRILRGSGPRGLRGIQPRRADGVVRPLIDASREEARAHLASRGLNWRTDATNADPARDRARLRAEVLPALERAFGPRGIEGLAGLADRMEREWAWTDEIVARLPLERTGDGLIVDRREMRILPEGLALRLLDRARAMLEAPAWSLHTLLEMLHRVTAPDDRGILDVPGARLWLEGPRAALTARSGRDRGAPGWTTSLAEPGELRLPTGARVRAAWTEAAPADWARGAGAQFDLAAARVRFPLVFRAPRPGDRLVPLGMAGSKTVADLLADAKVPRRLRPRAVVVESAGAVACVAPLRLAEGFRVGAAGGAALRLTFADLPPDLSARPIVRCERG